MHVGGTVVEFRGELRDLFDFIKFIYTEPETSRTVPVSRDGPSFSYVSAFVFSRVATWDSACCAAFVRPETVVTNLVTSPFSVSTASIAMMVGSCLSTVIGGAIGISDQRDTPGLWRAL